MSRPGWLKFAFLWMRYSSPIVFKDLPKSTPWWTKLPKCVIFNTFETASSKMTFNYRATVIFRLWYLLTQTSEDERIAKSWMKTRFVTNTFKQKESTSLMRSTDLLLRRTIKDVGSSCLLLIAPACDCEELRGRFSIIGHTMDSQSLIHTLNS